MYHINPFTNKTDKCRAKSPETCHFTATSHGPEQEQLMQTVDKMYEDYENTMAVYWHGDFYHQDIDLLLEESNNPLVRADCYTLGANIKNLFNEPLEVKARLIDRDPFGVILVNDKNKLISRKAREYLATLDKGKIKENYEVLCMTAETDTDLTERAAYKSLLVEQGKDDWNNVLKSIQEPDGWATYNPFSKLSPVSGFCYSPYPQHSKVVDSNLSPKDFRGLLDDYVKENKELLKQDDHYLGLWNDPNTGLVYLDVSINTMNAAHARQECLENDQIAFFDLQTYESITVDENATSGQGKEK